MKIINLFISFSLLYLLGGESILSVSAQELYQSFREPPKEARPRVWWHWMNGNISKEGIRKDLLWMERAGIAGFQNFDAGLETPQVVDHRIRYMTPEWKDLFRYTIHLADSLGMEMAIASSPGWSETGGPWVKDKDGMKKLVWRSFDLEGGKRQSVKLPDGYNVTGIFQNYTVSSESIAEAFSTKQFYRDIAVIAVKLPESDRTLASLRPVITTSGGDRMTAEQLGNDDLMDFATLKADKDGLYWINYEFEKPQTLRSIALLDVKRGGGGFAFTREIQCSDDGKQFKRILSLGYQGCILKTYNIPATTARYFRVCYRVTDRQPAVFDVSTMDLSPMTRVQFAGDKAGFAFYRLIAEEQTPHTDEVARLDEVRDLTAEVKNGMLDWEVPEGRWRVFRFGYSLTGKENHPASPEATGLEVDKLDPDAIREYFKNYLQTYVDASGGRMGPDGISYLLTDSYEAGSQTWTKRMPEEFRRRKGYDLIRWLPALTGMVLNSAEETERFLFDWRRTIGDMLTEYHYDLQDEILRPYGMKRYTESHENFRANLSDGMDCKRLADVPMSAFWMQYNQKQIFTSRFEADIRESASVAHIYGQNIAAAESFTTDGMRDGSWVFSPAVLKPTADAAMAAGLNRFVIHTSPHQPVDDKVPGLGLGKYGQWFDRNETWAEQAKAWTDYLSRSCFLLQQGRFVADVAYYYGEDNNATGLFMKRSPLVPKGYNYDYISPSVLLNILKVEGNELTTPGGARYRILMLDPNVKYMSLPVLRRIAELAKAGIPICGAKPQVIAGLGGDAEEFKQLVDEVWSRKNVTTGVPLEEVANGAGIAPDVIFSCKVKGDFYQVHRTLPEGEIYWLSNRTDADRELTVSFRVTGKKPVLWRADTGEQEALSYRVENGRTIVSLLMSPYDAVFVTFLENTDSREEKVKDLDATTLALFNTPWCVRFQEKRGAPAVVMFDTLRSYTESDVAGIKYFSGTATYTNSFRLTRKSLKREKPERMILDLGEVKDLAEVKINGKPAGIVWKRPYCLDITDVVKPGMNKIEIKVVNVWHNRLVGDVQPEVKEDEKVTYTQIQFFQANEPLLPAGLLGPVQVKGLR